MSMTIDNEPQTEHPDERDEETPEPQPGQVGTVLDLKAEPLEGPRALTRAAEMVPVREHGAAPSNFAHQITLAQYMAKAQLMVPQHFHGNVGDCLAIIDIATRAGLSPYMVAAKTYKDPAGKGIAFESQLYHAFLIGSGWLKDAALHCKYEGDGETRTCTVWGTLKGETEPRVHKSPMLKELLPAKNSNGVYKGSPLWGDKPDVQMFYDTSRDWSRMFAPIATLGMLAQYESIEHPVGVDKLFISASGEQTLRDRIAGTKEGAEGHRNGHAESELANVAADKGTITPAGEPTTIKPAKTKAEPKKSADKKPKTKEPERTTTLTDPKKVATKSEASDAADRAEALGDARRREKADKAKAELEQKNSAPKVPAAPTTEAEYQVYCMDWIEKREPDPEKALARWTAERELRDKCGVRTAMKNDLRFRIENKHGV